MLYHEKLVRILLFISFGLSAAVAADYAPLYFESLVDGTDSLPQPQQNTELQQKYWDDLMKYKIFGAHGVYFKGQQINIPDESGWFGTADGPFDMSSANGHHTVGGPIMIGGNVILSNGEDTLSSGPSRITGNVTMGYSAWPNSSINGNQCVKGSVAAEFANVVPADKQFFGSNYGDCPSSVPALNEDLRIPAFYYNGSSVRDSIAMNNSVANIDVPPRSSASESSMYDILIKKITFSNNSELNVRMPAGGRLTRIFLQEGIEISGHPKIRVQYMDSTAVYDYDNNVWKSGVATGVENIDYGGNLLFYMTKDLAFPAITSQDSIQGTFITTGKISIEQHMTLAGQLLADIITLNSEFDGSGFRYVPFDPPLLDPKLFSSLNFPENDSTVVIDARLSKDTKVDVHFDYCFSFSSKTPVDGMTADQYADSSDFNLDKQPMPICGVDTARVEILANSDTATVATQIKINVKRDKLMESYVAGTYADTVEILILNVMNLEGAVLDGNRRDGSFKLNIIDRDVTPETADTTFITREDVPLHFDEVVFPYFSSVNSEMSGVVIKSVPESGTLLYFDEPYTPDPVRVIPVDSLGKLVFVSVANDYGKDDENKYATFEFAVVAGNGGKSYDKDGCKGKCFNTVTLNVIPVNDTPVVNDTTYTISGHVINGGDSLAGSIRVEDVDDSSFTYAFDSTDANFALVDSLFVIDENTGVISVKAGVELNENITDTLYTIGVVVSDKGATTGGKDIKSATSNVTIKVDYKNSAPVIDTESVHITENSKAGTSADSTLKSTDKDVGDSVKKYTLVSNSDWFDVSEDGVITVKEGAKVDYEKSKSETLTIQVCDEYNACSEKKVVVYIDNVPNSKVTIVEGENKQGNWPNPTTIYTNVPHIKLTCDYGNSGNDKVDSTGVCKDTDLKEGCQDVIVDYDNPDLDGVAYDTVEVCYSSAAPVVTVVGTENNVKANNIYTIVEKVDADDPTIYINDPKNPITVTVKDTVLGIKDSFTVALKLDTLKISKDTYSTMSKVADSKFVLNEDKPVSRYSVNGEVVENSYMESFNGKDSVKITYNTDDKGNVIKTVVYDEKGKVDSIEVITVSYVTKVGDKYVTVSYQADAITGAVLNVDSDGNLYSSSSKGTASKGDTKVEVGAYKVSYDYKDGDNFVTVTYSVTESGEIVSNETGDIGYKVSYAYTNKYGNTATQSVFIVLDRVGPKVEIVSPVEGAVIYANYVDVVWTVNGVEQDTLLIQSLEKGTNPIVRFYKDKAGNMAADTIYVVMKDAKDVEVSIETPVTVLTKDKVEEYYAANPPKKGETFAVSIRNPTTGKEVETLIGGDFDTKSGSGDAPYPGLDDHLGPTLVMDIKLPIVNAVGGLATLDDLINADGVVPLEGVDAGNSAKVSVKEYIDEYCDGSIKADEDFSKQNLYNSKMDVKIWVYTTLGNFVDYFKFSQDLNDPSYTNDAGLLQMFFEMKPDKDGFVRAENGYLYATGAYLYKVEVKLRSELKCTLPPVNDATGKKKGDIVKSSDDLLKPFGYKRPKY